MALIASDVLESSHVEKIDGTIVGASDYFTIGEFADDVDCTSVVWGEWGGFRYFLDTNHG